MMGKVGARTRVLAAMLAGAAASSVAGGALAEDASGLIREGLELRRHGDLPARPAIGHYSPVALPVTLP
jgi:hypothetical protein